MALDQESTFEFHELFFSRTNTKGIILAGNSVFRRVSEYDWSDLIHRPHNTIRHEDMPRAVFYLLWKTILSGSPIGAYVKNKSKNGAYYWVYALVLPISDGGFLSVRLKPSSPIFNLIKIEYQKILNLEKTQRITPEQSANQLLNELINLGFEDYNAFVVKTLLEELSARQVKLNRPPIPLLAQFQDVLTFSQNLLVKSQQMAKSFKAGVFLPLNLTIQAAKLNLSGEPLAVVAKKYADMISEIQERFDHFEEATLLVQKEVSKCQYLICANILLTEVVDFFKTETNSGPIDVQNEMLLLEKVTSSGSQQATTALTSISLEFDKLNTLCEQLKTITTGLEIVRLMGKIEIARLTEKQDQLTHLIEELLKFKSFLVQTLDEIAHVSDDLKILTGKIISQVGNARTP